MNLEPVRALIEKEGVHSIDLKYADLVGNWYHISFPPRRLLHVMEHGIPFDGSSIPGMKSVEAGDMVLLPVFEAKDRLEAEGYRVATAASATEAKALMNYVDETPALLISDFHLLDGSTGVEAVSAIRDNYNASIPAFIVSGDTSKVVKDARLLDNCTLMCKPIDTNRLLAAARHAVNTGDVPLD